MAFFVPSYKQKVMRQDRLDLHDRTPTQGWRPIDALNGRGLNLLHPHVKMVAMKQPMPSGVFAPPHLHVRHDVLTALFAIAVACWLPAGQAAPTPPPNTTAQLLEWKFDEAGKLHGWRPNGDLKDVTVTNGVLACRGAGKNPILELQGTFNLKASPRQQIEVRLKADHDGSAVFFWSNTTKGRYGGFTSQKTTRFAVIGDGAWHTYRLMPFWHPEGKIIRLRLDFFDGAKFALESIRITEHAAPAATEQTTFDFATSRQGWQLTADGSLTTATNGLAVTFAGKEGFLLGPPLQIKTDDQNYIAIRMAVDKGRRATLFFATEQGYGLHNISFPIEADGREHTYNLDMLSSSHWSGRIVMLGLRPSDETGAQASLGQLKISDHPQGAPELKVLSFGLADALPRSGVPLTLSALISNVGGETASNLQAQVSLPDGLKIVSSAPANGRVPALGFGDEATWTWTVQADQPMTGETRLTISAPNADPITTSVPVEITARRPVAATDYVPEPKPVRGPYEVGVYYFPGWNTANRWQPIQRFPERRPVLGWYREGDPEVADWQIKWAVEHGITFFVYDWYWSQGARHLEHGLHDAYFKSRYHHLLKFCLLWANHNPPHTSSLEDCKAVTRFWIENYFRRPEHLMVDGKPAIIIFSPHRLTEDLGPTGVKPALEAMRAECRQANLKGLHIIACVGGSGAAKQAAEEGYDAVTAYNWPGLGRTDNSNYAPFETLLDGYLHNWKSILEQSPIPLAPLPISAGWDSRPWHGDNNLVRYGRTPELFKRHLEDAKRLSEDPTFKSKLSNLLLIEAWNELGEGSYIEPHKEFGFGYLDAIRDVFTDAPKVHDDVTPADVGRGPYDVPPLPPAATAWDFSRGDEGWLTTMGLGDVAARGGVLSGRTTSRDPAFFSPPLQAKAEKFTTVTVRLKVRRLDGTPLKDTAQLFWHTNRLPASEASSVHFELITDGQWHDYQIPVAANRRWRGTITGLRLDPCNTAGVLVEISSIKLQ